MSNMNKSSPAPTRELLHVSDEWAIPQITESLMMALAGRGPALAFSPTSLISVPANVAVVLSTTGSTGKPKDVLLSAKALISSAKAAHKFLDAHIGDRWSLLLPLTHIAGVNVLVRALELGTQVIDLRVVKKYSDVDFTSIVPTQLHRALNGDAELLNHLQRARAVLVGGAAASAPLLNSARESGINVITTYGMSEMSGGCIYNNQAIDGAKYRINSEGLIELSGPMMAEGIGVDGWFTTSDLGEVIADRILVKGRVDDVIVSGGENISLHQVEVVLATAFPGQEIMAIGIPDKEWGERLLIISNKEIDLAYAKTVLKENIGQYASPKEIMLLDSLPMKGIGKPDRSRARELFNESNRVSSNE